MIRRLDGYLRQDTIRNETFYKLSWGQIRATCGGAFLKLMSYSDLALEGV